MRGASEGREVDFKKVAQNASIKSKMSSEGSAGTTDSFGSDFGTAQ